MPRAVNITSPDFPWRGLCGKWPPTRNSGLAGDARISKTSRGKSARVMCVMTQHHDEEPTSHPRTQSTTSIAPGGQAPNYCATQPKRNADACARAGGGKLPNALSQATRNIPELFILRLGSPEMFPPQMPSKNFWGHLGRPFRLDAKVDT